MRLITLLISFLVVSVAEAQISNRCDQIIPGQLNAQDFIRLSPYFIDRSTISAYNCNTIQFVGPVGTDTSYTWTCILLNGDKAVTHDVTLIGNTTMNLKQCSDGTVFVLRVLFANLHSSGNASFCGYNCDSQGVNIETLQCIGRTPQDAAYIKNYLDTKLKVKITGTVYDSQSNCPKPKNCVAYN